MITPLKELEAVTFGENGNADKDLPPLADLIQEIEQAILKYVELEAAELATLLALWIVQSYNIKAFAFCAFLSLQSASPRCGKSRLLEVLGCMTAEPTPLETVPSAAVLYRGESVVIFLDEVDGLRNADKEKFGEVMAILNVAFKRGAVVKRCNKQSLKVERFEAYRAFAFAGLNSLSDALSDRCFTIRLKRVPKKMPRLNVAKLEAEAAPIRSGLSRWWDAYEGDVTKAYDSLPDETKPLRGYDDRLQDIAEPLLVLAMSADAEKGRERAVTDRFLKAMAFVGKRREASLVEESLKAFLALAEKLLHENAETFVPSHELVDCCRSVEGLEWVETTKRLKGLLKKFELIPYNNSGKVRGYNLTRKWVEEWSARYA